MACSRDADPAHAAVNVSGNLLALHAEHSAIPIAVPTVFFFTGPSSRSCVMRNATLHFALCKRERQSDLRTARLTE